MVRRKWIAFVVIGLGCGARQETTSQPPADVIVTGGDIVTLAASSPRVEALAVRGDTIVAMGSRAEIDELRGPSTKLIDLAGGTAVPGLIDAHMHFSRLGARKHQLFLDDAKSAAAVAEIVAEEAAHKAKGEWIIGKGWHTVDWDNHDYPSQELLTKAAPDNPVYLAGMANHAAWVNQRAMALAGVTRETPDPSGGQILRTPSGEATGVFLEDAQGLFDEVLPKVDRESKKQDFIASVDTALELGLTEVHDAGASPEDIELYEELLAEGKLKLRLYVMKYVPSAGPELERALSEKPQIGLGGGHLTIRAIKAYADGALGARGAILLEPYSDSPDSHGMPANSGDELYQIVKRSTEAGYQIAVHAIGDGGNRNVLDAIDRVESELGRTDFRPRIEHAQVLAPSDIPRFGKLGVIASMQPIHCTMDMGFAVDRLGPERAKGAYAWQSLRRAGAVVVGGADVPAFPVKYSNPLWGLYAAVTRQDHDGKPEGGFYPEERLDRAQALALHTSSAAYASFEETRKGTLEVGKLADLTVFSKDVTEIPARELLDTVVTMTIVGGEVVYRRSGVPSSPPAR